MFLDVNQVAERLNVSRSVVHRLIRNGELVPRNKRKDGAKKFYAKFTVGDVVEYKKKNGLIKTRAPKITAAQITAVSSPAQGIATRLNAIEHAIAEIREMVTQIHKAWV